MNWFATTGVLMVTMLQLGPVQEELDDLQGRCNGTDDVAAITKACDARDKLVGDLWDKGYCVYGHGVIGRRGHGDRCYKIKGN